MPSKFGGVSVEQEVTGSRFGGTPVDRTPPAPVAQESLVTGTSLPAQAVGQFIGAIPGVSPDGAEEAARSIEAGTIAAGGRVMDIGGELNSRIGEVMLSGVDRQIQQLQRQIDSGEIGSEDAMARFDDLSIKRGDILGRLDQIESDRVQRQETLAPVSEEFPVASKVGEVGTDIAAAAIPLSRVGAIPSTAARIPAVAATSAAEADILAGASGLSDEQRAEASGTAAVVSGAVESISPLVGNAIRAVKSAGADRKITKLLMEAAPSTDEIKDASRAIYKSLDDSAVTVKESAVGSLLKTIVRKARTSNVDEVLTPKSQRVVDLLIDEAGSRGQRSLTELDNIRKRIQIAANSTDPSDARVGAIMLDEFDSFVDKAGRRALSGGGDDVAYQFKAARALWGRARKSEVIEEVFDKASRQASGFENGLRTQLRQILNNKKRSRFFTKEELSAMDAVVKGSGEQNVLKLVGRLGFSEGQSTGALGSLVGLGVVGPVAPVAGQISKKLAQKSTEKAARGIEALVRSGASGRKIARAYMSAVPQGKRSTQELSELLLSSGSDVDELLELGNKFISDAAAEAKGQTLINSVIATGSASKDKEP